MKTLNHLSDTLPLFHTGMTGSPLCSEGVFIMALKRHGLIKTRIYNTWCNIKQRTRVGSLSVSKNYGNRGIKMCEEWKNDFMSFYAWSMNNGYNDNLTIDRKDNSGNYCPENCQWITNKEQQSNKRTNRNIEYDGETKTLTEWAKISGLEIKTLQGRIDSGWPIKKAMTHPLIPNMNDLTGNSYGRLTVLNLVKIGDHGAIWNCICSCGKTKQTRGSHLTAGLTKSCGCLQIETISLIGKNTVHEKPIIQYDLHGNFVKEFKSPIDAQNQTGIKKSCIVSVANKTEYKPGLIRKQSGGYIWKYKEVNICF